MRQLIDSGRHSEGRHRASQRKRRLVQAVSVTATVALFAGGVSVANAAPGDVSAASGTFLGGTLLGLDAGLVALIAGETAASTGSADQTESNTLDLTALSVVNIDIGGGVQVPLRVADLGVVGQYASALQSGSSVGASGLISSAGAIGTGITPAPGVAPGPLSLSLSQAIGSLGLPPATLSQVADLDLTVGVTSANASQAAPAVAVGDYEIAGATLDFSSPTLSGVIGTVQSGVGTLQTTVDGLDSALNGALGILNVLGVVSVGVDVDTTSLWAGVSGLLTGDITDPAYPGVTVNLEDGTVSVDLDQLHPLNGQAVDTDILSPAVIAQIEASVLGLVTDVLDEVTTTLTTAVRGLHVGGGATILGADILTLDTSVGAILDGDTSGIALLGLGLGLPGGVSAIVDALASPLESLITSITDLAAAALAPVNDELLPALSPIISGVLSLQVNNQQTAAGVFSETALRVTVLPQLSALTLEIANATVGPNALAAPVAPTLTGIAPDSGPTAGGTVVTLTGTGFMGGTTVTIGGVTIPAGSVTVNSATSLSFTTPAHAAGAVDVTATTPGGPSGPQTFTYLAAPTVTAIAPDSGPEAGGTSVTLTGTGFVAGATTVTIGGVTIPAGSVTVNSATSLTFATPSHAEGAVTVAVTTPGGSSGPQTFTYLVVPAAPTLTGITPVSGPVAGGTVVTLTGTGFLGTSLVTFGTDAATSFTVNSDTSITATSPAHAAGPVDVTVTKAAGSSGPQTFTYLATPTITAIAPSSGPEAGGTSVTVTGTGFVAGATPVTIGGTTIPAGSVTVNSATSLTFTTPAHVAGPVPVTVSTPGGPSLPQIFTYVAAPGAPTLTGIAPVSGPVAGGTVVTLTGTGFTGTTAVTFGADAATSFTVDSDTSITATSPAHAAGPVDVTVTTAAGPSGPQTFSYVAAPTVTGITPVSGPVAGGTVVTLTGTGFTGATAVTFGADAATSFTVNSDTSITATSPAHAAGPVGVAVTTVGGPSGPQTFTYVAAPVAPTALSLSPTHGPSTGGTVVTIVGSGFSPSDTVLIGGVTVTPTSIMPGTITFVVPAHVPGAVAVVVQGPGGDSGALSYDYDASTTIGTIDPGEGPEAGGTTVTITGSCFTGATGVLFDLTPATSFTVVSDTEITAIVPPGSPGTASVTVIGAPLCGNGTDPDGYEYLAAPDATGILPGEGTELGGTVVEITGTGFTGATAVSFDGIAAAQFTVNSDTSITATTPAHVPGTVDAVVTGPGGASAPLDYTFTAEPVDPGTEIGTVDPGTGPESGGNTVTITGSCFTGMTAVLFGGTPATSFTVVSDTTITAVVPAGSAGLVDVTVVGSATCGTATDPGGYEYIAPPSVSGIAPDSGPETGGTVVTLTGEGFTGVTSVTVDGDEVIFTVVDDSTITFTTPAHGPGEVDVVVSGPGGASDPVTFTFTAVQTPGATATPAALAKTGVDTIGGLLAALALVLSGAVLFLVRRRATA